MRKICFTLLLLVTLMAVAAVHADENFGVKPPLLSPTTDTSVPTIAQERTAEGFVPVGPDSTLVPATVRGFEPGNGKDVSFGVALPPTPTKAN